MMKERMPLKNKSGKPLIKKVALLLDVDGARSRSLAVALATYGADIAILFDAGFAEKVQATKTVIESLGKRCLIVPVEDIECALPDEPINKVRQAYGQIDIFIDYSSWAWASLVKDKTTNNGQMKQNNQAGHRYTSIDIMASVLDQLLSH